MGLVTGGIKMNASGIFNHLNNIPKNLNTIIAGIAAGVTNECISNSPVDTGYLRSQWNLSKEAENLWRVANNTEYIMYLEFGTRYFQGHAGFVRGSIARWQAEAIKRVKAAMK